MSGLSKPKTLLGVLSLVASLCAQPAKPKHKPLRPTSMFVADTQAIRKAPMPGRSLGRVDVARTMQALRFSGLRALHFKVWKGPNDLEDLKLLLEGAQKIGIQIWVSFATVVRGANSLPHKGAFEEWAREFAKLGKRYSSLGAVYIELLDQGRNPKFMHAGRIEQMHDTLSAEGIPLIAGVTGLNPRFVREYAGTLDGIVVHWTNMAELSNLPNFIEGVRALCPKDWKVWMLYNTAPVAWHPEPVEPYTLYRQIKSALSRVQGVAFRDIDLTNPATVLPGKEGYSKILLTVRDYVIALSNGQIPQPPKN